MISVSVSPSICSQLATDLLNTARKPHLPGDLIVMMIAVTLLMITNHSYQHSSMLSGMQLHPVAPWALPEEAVVGGDARPRLQVQLLRAWPAEREGDRVDQDHDQLLGGARPHLLQVLQDGGRGSCRRSQPGAERGQQRQRQRWASRNPPGFSFF